MGNAINLGNAKSVTRSLNSNLYPDTALSGCADPEYYNNKTFGDGGDVVRAPCAPALQIPVLFLACAQPARPPLP